MKRVLRAQAMVSALGWCLALYLRFVRLTSRLVVEPPDAYERVQAGWPVIIATWHGQNFMLGALRRSLHPFKVLVSRHRDGEVIAAVARAFGIAPIRGSGAREAARMAEKRSVLALRDMVDALRDGFSVTLTADIPKTPRVASAGLVTLAGRANRPLVPLAIVSARRHVFENAWDKAVLPLPFGTIVLVIGPPLHFTTDLDETGLEAARLMLENEMNRVTQKAALLAHGA